MCDSGQWIVVSPEKPRQRKFEIKSMLSMYGRASPCAPFISKMWADARVVDTKHPHNFYRLRQKRSPEQFVQKPRLSTNSSSPLVIVAIFPASFCDGKKRGHCWIRLLKLAWTIFWLVWSLSTLVPHDIAVQVTSSIQSITKIIWCYASGFPCQCSKSQTLQNL